MGTAGGCGVASQGPAAWGPRVSGMHQPGWMTSSKVVFQPPFQCFPEILVQTHGVPPALGGGYGSPMKSVLGSGFCFDSQSFLFC